MSILYQWAIDHNVPMVAVQDLQRRMGLMHDPSNTAVPTQRQQSEAWAQSNVRLLASQQGHRLFRNNVGVLKNERGTPIRFGLHNESAAVNEVFKSGDLIGIRRVVIQPEMVGYTFGQFWSVEVKEPGFVYTGAGREQGQMNWMNLVNSLGGCAQFSTGQI